MRLWGCPKRKKCGLYQEDGKDCNSFSNLFLFFGVGDCQRCGKFREFE